MTRTSSGSDFRAQTAWIGLLPENPTVRQLGPRGSVGYSSMISHPVRASSSSGTVILSAWRSLSACLENSYLSARTKSCIVCLSTQRINLFYGGPLVCQGEFTFCTLNNAHKPLCLLLTRLSRATSRWQRTADWRIYTSKDWGKKRLSMSGRRSKIPCWI